MTTYRSGLAVHGIGRALIDFATRMFPGYGSFGVKAAWIPLKYAISPSRRHASENAPRSSSVSRPDRRSTSRSEGVRPSQELYATLDLSGEGTATGESHPISPPAAVP